MLNTTKTKIALIGSAQASIHLAPYKDPEWFIFGCSPGAYPVAGPHAHAWMENHRWEPQVPGHFGTGKSWFTPEYCEWMTRFTGTVWMSAPVPPEIPNARTLPIETLIERYGPFFFTSSIAWMFALALETEGVKEIGLWGIDMAATEEWATQRPGCQHFVTIATQRGIRVTIPPESDLLQASYWYGVSENAPMMIKLTARRQELLNRKFAAEQRAAQANNEVVFLNGALDDLQYMINTWVTHQNWLEPQLGKTGNETRLLTPVRVQDAGRDHGEIERVAAGKTQRHRRASQSGNGRDELVPAAGTADQGLHQSR